MAEIKVSVIVPVYNTEEYLVKCLDSLVEQTLSEIEILVVNDGSPDGSQRIIDRYTRSHPKLVKSLQKPNGGLSDARNFGAQSAQGEFIGFVDSDDYVEPDMFASLYDAAVSQQCQVAMGQYIHYGLNDVTSVQGLMDSDAQVHSGTDFLLQHTSMVVWNKIYHNSIVHQFPFPHTWFEDVAWTPVIMTHIDRFAYVAKPFYHYIRREGSIASSHDDPRTLQGIDSLFHAIKNSQSAQQDAVVYMGLRRLLFEARVRKCYADKYIGAITDLGPLLPDNPYFLEDDALRATSRKYLDDLKVIPKRIYYAAFGQSTPTELQLACVNSWTQHLVYGDGEIVRLDETNCDVSSEPAIARMYQAGQYKAVGDYFKLTSVLQHGGVALSQNVMATNFIAQMLINHAFFSQTADSRIFDGAFGAAQGEESTSAILDRFLANLEGDYDSATALELAIASYLRDQYGLDLDGSTQRPSARVTLFGKGIFHSNYDGSNVATYIPEPTQSLFSSGYRPYSEAYVQDLIRDRNSSRRGMRRLEARLGASEQKINTLRSSNRWRLAWRFHRLDTSHVITGLARLKAERRLVTKEGDVGRRRAKYARLVDRSEVERDLVLLESFYGRGLLSNPLALFQQWAQRTDFAEHRFVWVLDSLSAHQPLISDMEGRYPNVLFVERGTIDYYTYLASAKYLINDVTFSFDYVKKADQVYINTWHSITVKTLGYDIPGRPFDQKNVVRNLLACDFFLAANTFVRDRVFLQAHRMAGIYPGKIIEEGHPRSDLTFGADRASVIRELQAAGLELDPDKKLLVYAPTWRGTSINKPTDDLDSYMAVVDALRSVVGERYSVLIRLHQTAHANLDLNEEIRDIAIPPTLDANRMFAATDVLITDYSSIFFDYLVTGRPVVFYIPDLEDYKNARGVYFGIDDLPGPASASIEDVVQHVESIDSVRHAYRDRYEGVASWATPKDDGQVSQRVLRSILDDHPDKEARKQRRTRVLFHAGPLTDHRTVQKLFALSEMFDQADYDMSVVVTDSKDGGATKVAEDLLEQGIRVLGRSHYVVLTRRERYLLALMETKPRSLGLRLLSRASGREWRRTFGEAEFDLTINLDSKPLLLSLALSEPNAGTSIIWLNRPTDTQAATVGDDTVKSLGAKYDHQIRSNKELALLHTKLRSSGGLRIDPGRGVETNGE